MSLKILGVMTGTSCDGLDASLVRFTGTSMHVLWSKSLPYPSPLRARTLQLQKSDRSIPIREFLMLHRDLGDWYAKALARLPLVGVDAIANHGQTVAHFPPRATLQIGEAACIAKKTGLTVISDFRWGDLVAGGQGAPLVPLFHQRLAQVASKKNSGIAIHNLGGISNLTYTSKGTDPMAWDTGPANLWIDAVIRSRTNGELQLDRGGRLARKGVAHTPVVDQLLKHPYFKKVLPKSTGRDDFDEASPVRLTRDLTTADALATVTLATARSIANDYLRFILKRGLPLTKIYLCGGGSKNPLLRELIGTELLRAGWHIPVDDTAALGVHPQFVESTAFAFLGSNALYGKALGGPWTGAQAEAPTAKITPGKNWLRLIAKLR